MGLFRRIFGKRSGEAVAIAYLDKQGVFVPFEYRLKRNNA